MDLLDFYQKVIDNDKLKGVYIGVDDELIAVEYLPSHIFTCFPAEVIEKADWKLIEDVLTIKRDPQVLYHMTRVVGYYSRVENWNKSKLGELKDRQKGDYEIK